jgi:hypothetical protein
MRLDAPNSISSQRCQWRSHHKKRVGRGGAAKLLHIPTHHPDAATIPNAVRKWNKAKLSEVNPIRIFITPQKKSRKVCLAKKYMLHLPKLKINKFYQQKMTQ